MLVCALACAVLCVWSVGHSRAVAPAAPEPAAQDQNLDFSKFRHDSDKHRSLGCGDCHQRASDNSVRPSYDGKASLPGHHACTKCHDQFVTDPNSPMCYICHTTLENGQHPVKDFPGLLSFNARFDHAQHNTGGARPANGCAACHTPSGRRAAAMSIPAHLNAHAQCYTCHTPNAQSGGRDIASCGVCHQLGSYTRTGTGARAFAVSFSHATHGRRQGLNCADCHNLRAGAAQRLQVTSTRPLQHFGSGRAQTCMTCHNGRRAFGDQNFNECAKCHKGTTFRL
jgi:c(7)-type cytochrome triheme protein